ncbi:MAG: hypothetical protein E7A11_18215 [Clostridium sp.]|uniref:hypothetical protein n=1 Tax=Bacillota TaxID=1239 RepID=UPI0029009933|nr:MULTISPECIES: hypothetical protein [Bacillota]MDU1096532.1 hypothetical protein [Clostridioides difficile]MDU1127187.1 hypothetical protein [Clostridium sp.]MDU3678307.1 hypothetical protein [Clostridium sp.]MDU5739598.1 hypothetical protein [Clostridium sp.]MDU5763419.1 hypothetical protein [Veillonella sp.]
MSRKVDKGFHLNYWKLSYRRRFVRNLWMLPLLMAITGMLITRGDSALTCRIISIILLVSSVFELIYNYLKWKKTEKS